VASALSGFAIRRLNGAGNLRRSDSIRNNLNLAPHLELRWLENRNSGCECGRNSRSSPAAGNGLLGRGDSTPKIPL
jgi:hypothetical protein